MGYLKLTANSVGARVALAVSVDNASFAGGTFNGAHATAVDIGFILVLYSIGASRCD